MERQHLALMCATLSAAFPNWNITAESLEVWNMTLADVDGEIAIAVASEWVLTEERPPTIAGIRRACAEKVGALPPTATDAWAEVSDVADRYGVYDDNRPRWSHDVIRKTVKAIGYYHICTTENISTTRAQFIKMYNDNRDAYAKTVIANHHFELDGTPMSALMSSRKDLTSGNQTMVELSPAQSH